MTWLDNAELEKSKQEESRKQEVNNFQSALSPALKVLERMKHIFPSLKSFVGGLHFDVEVRSGDGKEYKTYDSLFRRYGIAKEQTTKFIKVQHFESDNEIKFSRETHHSNFWEIGGWGPYGTLGPYDDYIGRVTNNKLLRLNETDWIIILGWLVDKNTLNEVIKLLK